MEFLVSVEQDELGDSPGFEVWSDKLDAIAAVARGRGEGDTLVKAGTSEVHARPFSAGGSAELLPGDSVIGAGDYVCPAAGGRTGDATQVEFETVDFGWFATSFEIELDPGIFSRDLDGRGNVAVEEDFALLLVECAGVAGGGGYPLRKLLLVDAVGDELRGEVVVVGAGLVGGAVQCEVAIGFRVENEGGTRVFFWVAGIDADTAGILPRVKEDSRRQKKECERLQPKTPASMRWNRLNGIRSRCVICLVAPA